MKISIDTGTGAGDEDDILARAYVAAVVGPYRRPQGRSSRVGPLGINGTMVQVAQNATSKNVLFVTVSVVSAATAPLIFSRDTSSTPTASVQQAAAERSFILMPGESLSVGQPGAAVNVFVGVSEVRF